MISIFSAIVLDVGGQSKLVSARCFSDQTAALTFCSYMPMNKLSQAWRDGYARFKAGCAEVPNADSQTRTVHTRNNEHRVQRLIHLLLTHRAIDL